MQNKAWQKLLSLESRDVVTGWFQQLHGRELNARRSKEIIAAARQAHEFFRNSANADFSVKPLLTFYGVASLSRATALLFRRDGGEESLTRGHGLETDKWSETLAGEISAGLRNISELKIRTTGGLFNDFIRATDNTMTLHVRSSAVDWRFPYPVPDLGTEITLKDILSRLPDLTADYLLLSPKTEMGSVSDMTFKDADGLMVNVNCDGDTPLRDSYTNLGYSAEARPGGLIITCEASIFAKNLPQFSHTYLNKTFGSIPTLYLTAPMPNNARYSQLGMTYMLSYVLGMLARYFPTYWISMIQGEKGDALWPTLNHAQMLVENSFPELIAELIADSLSEAAKAEPLGEAETAPA